MRLACQRAGRSADEIAVVAASKTVAFERLKQLAGCGVFICGENRVQELLDKYGKVDTEWHFIGRLQTNKVKYLPGKITLLQSLDRLPLAVEIEKQFSKFGAPLSCLVEINIGGEDSKGGIAPSEAEEFVERLRDFPHISVKGLMCIPPERHGETELRKNYLHMKQIYDKLKGKHGDSRTEMKYLSMGMSEDYALAIECGANMIRPGRAIFGDRGSAARAEG